MKTGQAGIDLIKQFEGCRLEAYKCPAGVWTIGYGHTAGVIQGQVITQAQADAFLVEDLIKFEKRVDKYSRYSWRQNEFDALVSFAFNIGSIDQLTANGTRDRATIAKKMLLYNKAGGKVLTGLVRRRKAEQQLFLQGENSGAVNKSPVKGGTSVMVGSARIDENGKISGGKAGDQTGKEVCIQPYYMSSKGWYMHRPINPADANAIAKAMRDACANDNIGYDQRQRATVIEQLKKYGSMKAIGTKAEGDCGTLVRGCCIEAGFDPGNFNTASESEALEKTGRFEKRVSVTGSTVLCDGDILVTKTKGHTVIVTNGNPRTVQSSREDYYPKYTGSSGSITVALAAVGEKDTSKENRAKIAAANNIANYNFTAAQNTKMVNLLKAGTLKRAGTASGNTLYYPKYTGTSSSVVKALAAVGEKNTSIAYRKKIAEANGISGYAGTYEQNISMIKLLKAGKLKKA